MVSRTSKMNLQIILVLIYSMCVLGLLLLVRIMKEQVYKPWIFPMTLSPDEAYV